MAARAEANFELLDYMERRSAYLKRVESFEKEVKGKLNKMETVWGEKIFYNSVIAAVESVLNELHAKARVKEVSHVEYKGPYLPSVKVDNNEWRFTLDRNKRRREQWVSCIVFLYPEQKRLLVNYTVTSKQNKKKLTKVALSFSGAETPPVIRVVGVEQKRRETFHVIQFEGLEVIKSDYKGRKPNFLTLGFPSEDELEVFHKDCQVFVEEASQGAKDLEDLSLEEFNKIRKSLDPAQLFEVIKSKHHPEANLEGLVAEEVLAYFDAKIQSELN